MADLVYDVLVVGAGPAGTAAGFELVRSGLSVLIVDRRSFPRKKACAGGVTPKAMGLFAYDVFPAVVQACHNMVITRPCGSSFKLQNSRPICYMTRRPELDALALNQVMADGARFLKIDRLVSLKSTSGGVAASFFCRKRQVNCRARYIVGADGANSKVRRLLDLPRCNIIGYPALEADLKVARACDIDMEFDFSRGIKGYYWIFPKADHVNIGIYAATPNETVSQRLLAGFARQRFGSAALENIKGYPIAVGGTPACAGRARVLLAGDAAGLAEPLFGEGIYFALKSGRLAAAAILRGGGPRALDAYRQALAPVYMDLRLHRAGAQMLYRFPRLSLAIGGCLPVKSYFSKGYSQGLGISQMLFPFLNRKFFF